MPITTANGATKVINLASNVGSLAVFILNGKTIFALGLAAGFTNMIGNYIGAGVFTNKGTKIVKPVMITVLVILFIKVIVELV